jgi:hypothetical protein
VELRSRSFARRLFGLSLKRLHIPVFLCKDWAESGANPIEPGS